jgi:hypothetical protein
MIDDFEPVLMSDDPDADEDVRRTPPRPEDDLDGWRSDFRPYLEDPE